MHLDAMQVRFGSFWVTVSEANGLLDHSGEKMCPFATLVCDTYTYLFACMLGHINVTH